MRAQRGQAVVELSLGALLFATLLILAMYSAETSLLTLKVQEAGNFAVWDSTGRRVHEFSSGTPSYSSFSALPNTEGNAATLRYKDFDGTGSARTGIKLSHVEGKNLRVTCQQAANIDFPVKDPGGLLHPQVLTDVQDFYRTNQGFMTCQADAELDALNVPSKFNEGPRGFFNNGAQAANMKQRPAMRVCSDRWCNGNLGVLLGSWALEGPMGDTNNAEVELGPGPTNQSYSAMTKRLFDDNGKGAGAGSRVHQFVTAIANENPAYNEDTFYMSYRGVESDYVEYLTGLKGQMTAAGGITAQQRGYDTNGAPLEVSSPDVWKWQRPVGGCGGCVKSSQTAKRSDVFLGLPLMTP